MTPPTPRPREPGPREPAGHGESRPPTGAGPIVDVAAWPKAELHLHLDGSLLIQTAIELGRTRDVDAPRDVATMRAALVAAPHGASQAELLRSFDLPVRLLQDREALIRVAAELVVVKAEDGVRYAEIRWAPGLHTEGGLAVGDVIEAVCDGVKAGLTSATSAGRPIVVRLIVTALRSHDPRRNLEVAEVAAGFHSRGVVGWDLAGDEAGFPDATAHAASFAAARAGGLRITCHAGEWGGGAQVRRALALDPERIAHGSVAADDPELCRELIRRGVTLDLCPVSNVQAGIVRDLADHPLARLHRAGVPVTLSTDDLTVSDITLSQEYRSALDPIGLTPAELWAIDRRALDVAFADEATLVPLRAEFDAWVAAQPDLVGPV